MPAERRSLATRTASTSSRVLPRRAMPGIDVSCSVPTSDPSASTVTISSFAGQGEVFEHSPIVTRDCGVSRIR